MPATSTEPNNERPDMDTSTYWNTQCGGLKRGPRERSAYTRKIVRRRRTTKPPWYNRSNVSSRDMNGITSSIPRRVDLPRSQVPFVSSISFGGFETMSWFECLWGGGLWRACFFLWLSGISCREIFLPATWAGYWWMRFVSGEPCLGVCFSRAAKTLTPVFLGCHKTPCHTLESLL